MRQQQGARFGHRRRRQVRAGPQEVVDLAEDPRSALRSAADHHGVGAGGGEHRARLLGRVDIAVGHDRDLHRALDRGDGVVLGPAAVAAGAGAAMQREHGDAGLLGQARDGQRVAVLRVPSGAELQGHRHVDRRHHRVQDARNQRLVLQQRRAAGDVAHFLRRAAHVDVDDLGATRHVEARRLDEHFRVGAGQLHRLGLGLAVVVQAPARLLAGPQLRVGGSHLAHRVAGAQLLAQLAKRPVGDAGHRCHEQSVRELVGADAHGGSEREGGGRREGGGL